MRLCCAAAIAVAQLAADYVHYAYREAWRILNGRRQRLPTEEMEKCREAARFIAGAFSGHIYRSCIHMPPKPFRRVVFDEVHDLVECKTSSQFVSTP